jgi:hypothetical protein
MNTTNASGMHVALMPVAAVSCQPAQLQIDSDHCTD